MADHREHPQDEMELEEGFAHLMALRNSFVTLGMERGPDNVSIVDIVEHANVSRTSFIDTYANKTDFVTQAFRLLIDDLSTRLEFSGGPWTKVRPELVELLFRHAEEHRDIYLVCLHGTSGSKAREEYRALVTRAAEANFRSRIEALGRTPRVPVVVMAHVAAGAYLSLLELWLSGELEYSIDEVAAVGLNLLICGLAWGHGLSLEEIQLVS